MRTVLEQKVPYRWRYRWHQLADLLIIGVKGSGSSLQMKEKCNRISFWSRWLHIDGATD